MLLFFCDESSERIGCCERFHGMSVDDRHVVDGAGAASLDPGRDISDRSATHNDVQCPNTHRSVSFSSAFGRFVFTNFVDSRDVRRYYQSSPMRLMHPRSIEK